tara:strand:+ start:1305 stop:2063 length:759 start_codon:yes stop_codon:yes gene_type:complete
LQSKLNYEFDFCIHCASCNEYFLEDYSNKAIRVNSIGTRNLLACLRLKNLKNFIYFSTFHVYGQNNGTINENSPISPKNDYSTTHLFAEYYINQFNYTDNLKFTILRLTNSYGVPTSVNTDKWYLVLNNLVKMALKEKKIILNSNGKIRKDFIGMNDVAVITEKILKIKATNDIYNLSSNKSYKILDIAKIVKDTYEKRYKSKIKIIRNINDKNQYGDLKVINKKIKNLVNFKLNDSLENEVNKLFFMLEQK